MPKKANRNAASKNQQHTPSSVTEPDTPECQQWSAIRSYLGSDDPPCESIPAEIATHLDQGSDYIVLTNSKEETAKVFVYHPSEGIYKPDGKLRTREFLADRLGMNYYEDSLVKKSLETLGPRNYARMDDIGHVPEKIAVDDPGANWRLTEWDKLLGDAIPSRDDRLKLQEYAGYTLHHWDVPYRKTLLLLGPTASGKSTILNAINEVLGTENVLNESIQRLSGNQFAAGNLPGTIANINNDLGTQAIYNTGLFKKMAAGERITIEEKYESAVTYKPTQKQLYACNQVPDVRDPDDAFFDRWLFVEVPETVPREKRDHRLQDRLLQNKSVILDWMLDGYARLCEQSHFSGERSLERKQSLWLSHGGVMEQWIGEKVTFDSSDTPEASAYEDYRQFCANNDQKPLVKSEFTKRLLEYGVQQRRPGSRGGQTRVYRGMSVEGVLTLAEEQSRP